MLFETLNKLKQKSIMASIVILAVGILLLICPEPYIDTLITLAGYVLMVASVVLILKFISSRRSLTDFIVLGIALAMAILGVVVLVSHDNILPVLSWLFGILLLVDGIFNLYYAMTYARRAGRTGWQLLIILAFLLIAAGLLIVINPWWKTPKDLMVIISCAMIFSAITGILRLIWIWPVRAD